MLRSALIVFFELRAQVAPERLADESIRRVAQAIGNGQEIGDPNTYSLAVARHLLREPDLSSRFGSQNIPSRPSERASAPNSSPTRESFRNNPAAIERLKTCLNGLSPEDLALLRQYYPRKGVRRKDHRQRLAHQLGVSTRTLLMRIYHIEKTLDECLPHLPNA
jgi:hypothetical protein